MHPVLSNLSPFTRTRLVLSMWYTLILLLILTAFSLALLVTYNNDVTRIVLRQDFGTHVPRTLSHTELHLIVLQVRALRLTSLLDIMVIDVITLLLGAGLGYFLAGKTLSPIQKNMESQKVFIADASHELKNPIATIQAACDVVLRSPTKTRDDYKIVLEQVHDQSKRLGRLVNDLLSLSVLDAITIRHFQQFSLSTLVTKEVEVMDALLKISHIKLEKSIDPQVFISGDPEKVKQLVIILLDNAIKYTPKKGKITVQVSHKPQPKLLVRDTGIGIAPEKHEAIFNRFYQGDDSHAGDGAGLGLSIAKSIMNLHRGKIQVESSENNGATFICLFPK